MNPASGRSILGTLIFVLCCSSFQSIGAQGTENCRSVLELTRGTEILKSSSEKYRIFRRFLESEDSKSIGSAKQQAFALGINIPGLPIDARGGHEMSQSDWDNTRRYLLTLSESEVRSREEIDMYTNQVPTTSIVAWAQCMQTLSVLRIAADNAGDGLVPNASVSIALSYLPTSRQEQPVARVAGIKGGSCANVRIGSDIKVEYNYTFVCSRTTLANGSMPAFEVSFQSQSRFVGGSAIRLPEYSASDVVTVKAYTRWARGSWGGTTVTAWIPTGLTAAARLESIAWPSGQSQKTSEVTGQQPTCEATHHPVNPSMQPGVEKELGILCVIRFQGDAGSLGDDFSFDLTVSQAGINGRRFTAANPDRGVTTPWGKKVP